MDKKQFVIDYIDARVTQDFHEDQHRKAIDTLAGGSCDYEAVIFNYHQMVQVMLAQLIGEENVNWIDWFLYENFCDTGRRGGTAYINDHEYDIETVDQLFDLCLDHTTFNEVVFG